jgi:fucose 4-O-acetylase-like acetyltransferase
MPLFVFISGYFSRKKDTKTFITSCSLLIGPLLLFHIISFILDVKHPENITLTRILTPWWVLWYLLSLFYWRTILQVIPNKILKHSKMIICLSFLLGIIAGFMPFDRFLSIQRTFSFLPFFFLGYYMRNTKLYISSKYKIICLLFLVLIIPVVVSFPKYLGSLAQADPYTNINEMFGRILVYLLCIPMSFAFINICPNNSFLAKQGRYTMQYYIYHAFALIVFGIIMAKFSLPRTLIASIIYTMIIILGIYLSLYIPFVRKLVNPIQFFKR